MGLYTYPQVGVLGGTPTLTDRAHGAGDSAYPSLWHKKVFDVVPCLGPTWSIAPDYTGYHTGGVLTNMNPATDWVQRPQAVSFGTGWAIKPTGGSDDYIEYNDAGMWLSSQNDRRLFSVAAWFTNVAAVSGAALFTKGQDSFGNLMQYHLKSYTGTFAFEVGHGTSAIRAFSDDTAGTQIPNFSSGVPIFTLWSWGGNVGNYRVNRWVNGFGPRFDNFGSGTAVGGLMGTKGAIRLFNSQDSTNKAPNAYIFRVTAWNRMISHEEVQILTANALADYIPIRHTHRRFTHMTMF